MKKILSFLLLLIFTLTGARSQQTVVLSADDNLVTVRVTLYDIKKKEFQKATTDEALRTVLFRGLPGTSFSRPLVGYDENTIINENRVYFDELFSGRTMTFTHGFIPQIAGKKDATGKKAWTADITVNMKALRGDLEHNKIIRKFGL